MKTYNHLTEEERNQLVVLVNRKKSLREIAKELGRHHSTIFHEITRNNGRKRYRANTAHKRAVFRHYNAHRRTRLKSHALRIEVEKLLMNKWSPEIISGRLKQRPDLPPISPEAIYQWIYADAPHLIGCLTRSHKTRWPKGKSKHKRYLIPNRVSIKERPKQINQRAELGHWEADLLIGKGVSALQVVQERKARLAKLKKTPNKKAPSSRSALANALAPMPKALKKSITYDNGFENTEHGILNAQLGTSSYFCEPYHSWEKGSVENTNGLIRRFFPKKTNFDTISNEDIKNVENWLNNRPRKCLGFKTPLEVLNSLGVALTG
jgi:IS30 family transposase